MMRYTMPSFKVFASSDTCVSWSTTQKRMKKSPQSIGQICCELVTPTIVCILFNLRKKQ